MLFTYCLHKYIVYKNSCLHIKIVCLQQYLHCTHIRRTCPPPHHSLSNHQARIYRRLQTETFYNHTILSHISPSIFHHNCPQCDIPLTTYHLVYSCPPPFAPPPLSSGSLRWPARRRSIKSPWCNEPWIRRRLTVGGWPRPFPAPLAAQ